MTEANTLKLLNNMVVTDQHENNKQNFLDEPLDNNDHLSDNGDDQTIDESIVPFETIRETRDSIPLILFVLTYLFFVIYPIVKLAMMDNGVVGKIQAVVYPSYFVRNIGIGMAVLTLFTLITVYLPEELMTLAILISISNCAMLLYCVIRYSLKWYVILAPAIPLAFLLLYYIFFYKKMELTLKTLKISGFILRRYIHYIIGSCLIGFLLILPTWSYILIVVFTYKSKVELSFVISATVMFNILYLFVLKSFLDLFVSSLIFCRIYGVANVVKTSFIIAIKSSGTTIICAIIDFILYQIKHFVQKRNRSNLFNPVNIVVGILGHLLGVSMDIVIMVADIWHRFIIGFVALTGRGYVDSFKNTAANIENINIFPVGNYLATGSLCRGMEFMTLSVAVLVLLVDLLRTGVVHTFMNHAVSNDLGNSIIKVVSIGVSLVTIMPIITLFYRVILNGSMSVLLMYCVNHKQLVRIFPEFIIEKEV